MVEEETKKLIANQNENRALIESKVEDESIKTRERVEDVGQKLREGQESIQEKMTTKDDLAVFENRIVESVAKSVTKAILDEKKNESHTESIELAETETPPTPKCLDNKLVAVDDESTLVSTLGEEETTKENNSHKSRRPLTMKLPRLQLFNRASGRE